MGPTMLAHADRHIGAAKLQAGAQTAAVLAHADGSCVKGPTGPMFPQSFAVHGHASGGNTGGIMGAKVQEGATLLGDGTGAVTYVAKPLGPAGLSGED